jgi:GTPase SAR1 family protein
MERAKKSAANTGNSASAMSMTATRDRVVIKVIVLGSSNVGKTALMER